MKSKGKLLSEIIFCSVVVFISGLLGILVVIPFIIIYHWDIPGTLVRSFAIGFINGLSCTIVFTAIIYRNIRLKTFWSFLAVFITTAIAAYTGATFIGMLGFHLALIMVIVSEIIALTITVIIYRYTKRLNDCLDQTKQRLRNARES